MGAGWRKMLDLLLVLGLVLFLGQNIAIVSKFLSSYAISSVANIFYFYEFTWSTIDFLYFEEETKKTSSTDINETDDIEQENNLSKTDSGNENLHEKVYFV